MVETEIMFPLCREDFSLLRLATRSRLTSGMHEGCVQQWPALSLRPGNSVGKNVDPLSRTSRVRVPPRVPNRSFFYCLKIRYLLAI